MSHAVEIKTEIRNQALLEKSLKACGGDLLSFSLTDRKASCEIPFNVIEFQKTKKVGSRGRFTVDLKTGQTSRIGDDLRWSVRQLTDAYAEATIKAEAKRQGFVLQKQSVGVEGEQVLEYVRVGE